MNSQSSNAESSTSQAKAAVEKDDRSLKYGTSCLGCRRRKQRCDARIPACGRCIKLKEQCVYEGTRNQAPPQTVTLLFEALAYLKELATKVPDPTRSQIEEWLAAHPLPTPGQAEDEPKSRAEDDERHDEVDELLMHMSLADDGQNGHFGVTSLVYQTPSSSVVERLHRKAHRALSNEPRQQVPREEIWATEENAADAADDAEILRANGSMIGGWESLAYHKLELEFDAAHAAMVQHLLKTYFCWQYGSHCTVYRHVFIRDMALSGPYFNDFLLNVICAHAARYSDYHMQHQSGTATPAAVVGADFLTKAKQLLATEMDKPSSIPTIQGLLILGQRECACGNLSQGWQYTGMAFRAMRDLGIHLDCNRLPIFGFGTMSAEDREIRRRLFWSAYTWDKEIISLALGRTPTFNAWQNVSPGPIVDDSEDDSEWYPYFWQNQIPLDMIGYPVHKSLFTLNFRHFSKLCEIIQKIIMRLYNGRPSREGNGRFVEQMKEKLEAWMVQLPESIKLDTSRLPEHCPPPHIFSTNALYRASWILLYRIFLPNALPVKMSAPKKVGEYAALMCTRMAEELHQLFQLYAKSFGLRNMTYTLSWSMYSAATINAIDFLSGDPQISAAASPRLSLALHVLERGSHQVPGTKRSIEIIKQRLRQPMPVLPKRRIEEEEDEPHKRSAPAPEPATALPVTSETMFDWSAIDNTSPQSSRHEDVLEMWSEIMAGSGGNSVDLMQGLMAMPATSTATGTLSTYPEWTPDWWLQPDQEN